jgi:hypothetical protein
LPSIFLPDFKVMLAANKAVGKNKSKVMMSLIKVG